MRTQVEGRTSITRSRRASIALGAILTLAFLVSFGADARAQDTLTDLYNFTGVSGASPAGTLIADASGNLYGTTVDGGNSACAPTYTVGLNNGCGTVFELVNASGAYTEKVLYNFAGGSSDGQNPYGGLVMDSAGNLYGTTLYGGSGTTCFIQNQSIGCGILFELSPSGNGSYTERILHMFAGWPTDGQEPYAGLIMDSAGDLYGTTSLGGSARDGTVFELVNSSGNYTEQLLHNFTGGDGEDPTGSLIMDSAGNLYGTTGGGGSTGGGTVFELVNASGYTVQVLNGSFDLGGPFAGVIMDGAGNLYGTSLVGGASQNGSVFELVNSSGTYTGKLLYGFTAGSDGRLPYGGLIMDSSQNLYGTTVLANSDMTNGTVFELANSSGNYTEETLYSFSQGGGPLGSLLMDASGNLFGAASEGGSNVCGSTCGYVFEISAPQSGLLGSNNTFTGSNTFSQTIAGSITGNAGTVTNGVYTSASYADPGWITSLSAAKITGTVASAAVAGTATTAGALAATPSQCGANTFSTGIAANGNANCTQPASTNLSDYSTLVFNDQANAFAGGKQTLAPSATGYASLNLPNSGAAPSAPAMGDVWLTTADAHPKFQDGANTTQSLAFLSDVSSTSLLSTNNTFTGVNTFSQTIIGSISGNAATATSAVTATIATTATSALTATSAGSATTAGALAITPEQCANGMFATGIAANGNANCASTSGGGGIAASQILFSSAGAAVQSGEFMGISAPSSTEGSVEQIVAFGGHVTAMQCYSQTAPKGSKETFTLRLNTGNTAGVCTIAAGATKGSVTGLSLAVSAGNLLDLQVSGPKGLSAATAAAAVGP